MENKHLQERYLDSEIFQGRGPQEKRSRLPEGSYREPARDIPIYRRTDVLVIGGGPAGSAAAISAARAGADVTLVERYNHLGGLSTGGLVLWIDRMTDWNGCQVIQGIANDLLGRLPPEAIAGPPREHWGTRDPRAVGWWQPRTAAFHGVVTWSPTIDPEWLKAVSLQAVLEARIHLMLHCWAVAPILDGNRVQGAIFESKAGRQAVVAKVVVDASGDGDMYALAGAPFESDINASDIHHCMNVAWLFGGVDMERWIGFLTGPPEPVAVFTKLARERLEFFERPFVSWRRDVALFMGPRLSGFSPLDLEDLTEVEIRSRKLMVEHLNFYREHAPGFEGAFLMLSAPQIGARHSRRLIGTAKVRREQWESGIVLPDEIGVSPSPSERFPSISIPYGSLICEKLDNLLAAGRHIACDAASHTFMREIPQCWMTGQAAGVAAAMAANRNVAPRELPVKELQRELLKQGAYVRTSADEAITAQHAPTRVPESV